VRGIWLSEGQLLEQRDHAWHLVQFRYYGYDPEQKPVPATAIRFFPVSKPVNNASKGGAELIERIAAGKVETK
jgi:hypothetical protein